VVIDANNTEDINRLNDFHPTVAIEFTTPETAFDNISACFRQHIPVVSGTTGWLDRFGEIKSLCSQHNGTLFYASNFSLGVNLFMLVNQYLAGLMSHYPDYSVLVEETHHIHKKDKPSGTAISLAEGIIDNHSGYAKWSPDDEVDNGDLPIISVREGEVPGTHRIVYKSGEDNIEIKHEAFGRKGFALGAVLAAEWVSSKKGIFTMNDFLNR